MADLERLERSLWRNSSYRTQTPEHHPHKYWIYLGIVAILILLLLVAFVLWNENRENQSTESQFQGNIQQEGVVQVEVISDEYYNVESEYDRELTEEDYDKLENILEEKYRLK